ncbi:type I-E CRISPR-associated protein Cse2/CasB [Microbispora rosea]|uniref:type I-E CRISPR-associated protein Cse2/CasB n=1 Tax=Microbispora rosea TaxID=58117 RepID=UPI003673A418
MATPYWNRAAADGTWLTDTRSRRPLGPPPGEDLAAMRAGLGRGFGEVPKVWPYYTVEINDELARRGQASVDQKAEHAALALYGLHQQSKSISMHRPNVRLGTALARLRASDRFSDKAIDDRVEAAATTTTPDALLIRLRGLIDLLRVVNQPLDYTHLMGLIRDWHYDDGRRAARRTWALDYQVWKQTAPQDEPAAAS